MLALMGYLVGTLTGAPAPVYLELRQDASQVRAHGHGASSMSAVHDVERTRHLQNVCRRGARVMRYEIRRRPARWLPRALALTSAFMHPGRQRFCGVPVGRRVRCEPALVWRQAGRRRGFKPPGPAAPLESDAPRNRARPPR